jgi:hypothetical protein
LVVKNGIARASTPVNRVNAENTNAATGADP